MAKNDGGPAFPSPNFYEDTGMPSVRLHAVDSGMSLRDWFAGQAPELAQVINCETDEATASLALYLGVNLSSLKSDADKIRLGIELGAKWKFAWADAMLAAREAN